MYAIADQPRGCGKTRDAGGVYMEVGFSPYGKELEELLFDPIVECFPEHLGLSPRAPLLFFNETEERYDVIDWVGESHYPNPADFLEEVRRLGLSRKLELHANAYNLLSRHSRVIIVLPHAYIDPQVMTRYVCISQTMRRIGYNWDYCPTGKHHIENIHKSCCAGTLWNRTDKHTEPHSDHPDTRYVQRQMPAFTYNGVTSCSAFLDADPSMFRPGFVASFLIGRLAVVADPIDNLHNDKLEKLSKCALEVELVDL